MRDTAVSPVIGTILMIAATVILGGVVYAALSPFFSGEDPAPKSQALVSVKPVDTNGNGRTDTLRVTYLTGEGTVTLRAVPDTEGVLLDVASTTLAVVGDATSIKTDGATAAGLYLTVTASGSTILDAHYALEE